MHEVRIKFPSKHSWPPVVKNIRNGRIFPVHICCAGPVKWNPIRSMDFDSIRKSFSERLKLSMARKEMISGVGYTGMHIFLNFKMFIRARMALLL